MNALISLLTICVTLSALMLSTGLAQATGIDDYSKGHGGTLACGGSHFSRVAGNELHRTAYVFRNFSGYATIRIERILVFDANGNVLFEYPGVDLPVSVKTELGPHETTQINTGDILVEDLEPAARPIQTHVKWSYNDVHKGIALNGSTVRTVRAADTGAELSRASSECSLINHRR